MITSDADLVEMRESLLIMQGSNDMEKYFRAIPILWFAHSRSKIAEDLEDNVQPIITHLIKLWRYPGAAEVSHWRQEVYNFLNRTRRLKRSNKYPSAEFILKNTYDVNKADISKWLNDISHVYDGDFEPISIRTDVDLMNIRIKEYFEWLANELSSSGYVISRNVYSKLKELEFGNA